MAAKLTARHDSTSTAAKLTTRRDSAHNGDREWLSVGQAAQYVGISAHTLREWTASGVLRASRTAGGHRRYARTDLERFRAAVGSGLQTAEIHDRVRELAILADVSQSVFEQLNPTETLKRVCEKLAEAMDCTQTTVSIYDPDAGVVRTLADYDVHGQAMDEGEVFAVADYPLTASLLVTGEPVTVNVSDPGADPAEVAILREYGNRSLLMLPLVYRGEIVGLVELVDRYRERVYSDADLRLANELGGCAAAAVNNARVFEQLERQNRELKLMLDAGAVLSTSDELRQALTRVAELLTHALGCGWCDIYDYDAEANEVEVLAFYQLPEVPPAVDYVGTRYAIATWPDLERAIAERQPTTVHVDDPETSDEHRAEMDKWDEKSTINVPIVYQDQVIGVLDVAEFRYDRQFTDDELRLIWAVANQAAAAIHNLRLLEETRRRNVELQALLEISDVLRSTPDTETIMQTMAEVLVAALDVTFGEVYSYDRDKQELRAVIYHTVEEDDDGEWTGVYKLSEAPDSAVAIREKQPIVVQVDDPNLWPVTRAEMEAWREKSAINVPVLFGNEVVALAYLAQRHRFRRFTKDDIRLVTALAAQGGAAIEAAQARAREQTEAAKLARLNDQLSALVEMSAQMRGLVEVDDVLTIVGRVVLEVLGFRQWTTYLYEPEEDAHRVAASMGATPELEEHYRELVVPGSVVRGLLADATRMSNSFFVDHNVHVWTDEEQRYIPGTVEGDRGDNEWHSDDSLFVPMVSDTGQLIGYVEAYDPVDRQRPTVEMVRQLEIFAAKAASNIEVKRLYAKLEEQATTDALTGLRNRRYLDERLEEEVAGALRYGRDLSVVMIDIDDFKPFNDTYGHPQGDKLLRAVADILRTNARSKVDIVTRYGGEEFVIVLPSTPATNAHVMAERLRKNIGSERTAEAVAEAIRTATEGRRFEGYPNREEARVTVSCGIASLPDHANNPEELIEVADKALYVAKRLGKNRTCIYSE